MERTKKIIRTSIVGIIVNIVLVAFKAFVGLVSGSVAVILDAVNNLSDVLSSTITIIGTKLSAKAPDKKHPYGHGRVEYITSAIISAIVLVTGVLSLKESIEKTITWQKAEYNAVAIIIIVGGILAKIAVGIYFKKMGKTLTSGALTASGTDALSDASVRTGSFRSPQARNVMSIHIASINTNSRFFMFLRILSLNFKAPDILSFFIIS